MTSAIPALPPIEELIPHRRPMRLVDEVVAHEGLRVVCRTTIRADMPFVEDGQTPALLALELFAQSAASLVSLLARAGGQPMRSGAILGTREIRFHVGSLQVGDVLEMRCEERMALGATAQIECSLHRGDELLAEGSINVMAGSPPANSGGAS